MDVLWPGQRQRFMGERTKTFIENTFSIWPHNPPSSTLHTSNCKFNKALYNMAKTYTHTHPSGMAVTCVASAIIYNILIELDATPGAGRRNMVDGHWPRSKMHFKCRLAELWHLAAEFATSSGKTKRMAHHGPREQHLNMCQQICARVAVLNARRNEKGFKVCDGHRNYRPGCTCAGSVLNFVEQKAGFQLPCIFQ